MKFYLSCLLFFVPSLLYANHFYTGIGLGYDSTNFHKLLTISHINSDELYYKNDNLNGDGLYVSGFIGYKWIINRISIATELSTHLNSLKYHGYVNDNYNTHEISHGDFTINKSYGVSLLPGFLMTENVVLYGRIGAERGYFKYSEHKIKPNGANGITETKWLNGIRYGIGMATELSKTLQLQLEYNRIAYQTYFDNTYPLAPDVVRIIKLTPKSNQMELSLVYNFQPF